MRRIIMIAIVIIVLVGGAAICSGQLNFGSISNTSGPGDSPKETVKGAITSLEDMNPDKTVSYFTPVPGSAMKNRLALLFSNMDSLDIENMRVIVIAEEGVAAKVQVSYSMIYTAKGYINAENRSHVIKLVKIEDKWYINEAF